MEQFREYADCRLCKTDDYEIEYEWPANFYDHSQFETASWDGRKSVPLQICKCNKCGLAYTNPSFKEEYLNLVYPTDLIPNPDKISSKEDFTSLFHFNKYKSLFSHVENELNKDSSIVDIGTRYGGLPYYINKKGYSAYGLELNDNSVELAKKFGFDFVYKGTIKDLKKYAGQELPRCLDCVIMDDVLEHLVNPIKDITEISNHQKKGGKIVMRQMNWNSLGHKLFGKSWYYLQPGAHMSYFTPKTAKLLLNECGYENSEIFEVSLLENIFKTFKRVARNKIFGEKEWTVKNKIMYLQERNKSFDDMFIIIGEKS